MNKFRKLIPNILVSLSLVFISFFVFLFVNIPSSYAACGVYWDLQPLNPSANQNIAVTVVGIRASSSNWTNVHLLMDGNKNGISQTSIVAEHLIYRYTANAGAAGSKHTLTFQADGVNCTPVQSFNTGGGAPISKIHITPDSPDPGAAAKITSTTIGNCSTNPDTQPGAGLTNCVEDGGFACDGGHGISGDSNPCWFRWACKAVDTPGTYTATFRMQQGDPGGNCSASLNYKVGNGPAATDTPPPGVTTTIAPSSIPTPSTKTVSYRFSETRFDGSREDGSAPEWRPYTNVPMKYSWQLKDAVPGKIYTLFIQFKTDDGRAQEVIQKSIKYIGSDPTVSNIACQYDPIGEGTRISMNGTNFGARGSGTITVDDKITADILSWSEETPTSTPAASTPVPTVTIIPTNTLTPTVVVPTPTPTTEPTFTPTPTIVPTDTPIVTPTPTPDQVLGVSTIRSSIEARVEEKLTKGRHKIEVKLDDGRKISRNCDIGITSVDFAAKNQCRPTGNFSASNVRVQIREKASNAKPVFDDKINISADGAPQWKSTPPQLEVDKIYTMVIKSPKGLGVKKEFTAKKGTTALEDIILPVGDIAPIGSPDNKVTAQDYSQLVRDWIVASNPTSERVSDLNGDSRVNSFDYSCMRANFNNNGADFLKGQ